MNPNEKTRIDLNNFFDPMYMEGPDGLPTFKMLIDGEWVFSSNKELLDVYSPIDSSLIARVTKATVEDTERAINIAYESKNKIRAIPAIDRIEIFEKTRELLLKYENDFINVIVTEMSKTLGGARSETRGVAERLKLTMQEASSIFGEYIPGDWVGDSVGKMALVIREPKGLVGAIGPFNYPLYIPCAKIIPALLAGNAVVAKPASDTPVTLLLFGRVLEVAGMPAGTINVITGSGREVGGTISTSEKIDMISFTGSTATGKRIANMAGLKSLHLELGGKAPAIVCDDADLDLAAKKCILGSFKHAGQRCDAISRVLVHENIAETFIEKVLEEVEKWKIGDPRDPEVKMGPVINQKALERIDDLVKDAINRGAILLKGGKYEGLFYEPTILNNVPVDARIAIEETFGPVMPIIHIKDLNEAIEISNKSEYGLDAAVFTNSFYTAWETAKSLQDGEITLNDAPTHGVGTFPFGGIKNSGLGREGLGYSIDEVTMIKTIVFNLEPAGLGKKRLPHF
jgi:glyceraldehyde-3-phosphate dehydrogenase [NAD(P)+]